MIASQPVGRADIATHPHGKLPGIHGLRFLAAMMVIFFHLRDVAGVTPPTTLDGYLGAGVRLFFAISAFSLMYSTTRYIDRPGWIRIFALKRFFRIAPLFYVMTVITGFTGYMGRPGFSGSILNLSFLFNFIPNFQGSSVWAGWTVGVEMVFYAIFPLIIGIVRKTSESWTLLFISIVIGFSVWAAPAPGMPPPFPMVTFPGQMQFFAAGVLAYFVYTGLAGIKASRKMEALLAAIALIGVALLLWPASGHSSPSAHFLASSVACILLFGTLIVWQAWRPRRIFSNRFAIYWGERSYGIYLVHGPILMECAPLWRKISEHSGPTVAYLSVAAIAMPLILFASSITYRLIEIPGMKLGERFYRARETALRGPNPVTSI